MFDDLEQTRSTESPAAQTLQLAVLGPRETRYADLPERGAFLVGRARGADLRLTDPQVSRRHLVLQVAEQITIEELGSRNGTRHRGRLLAPHAPVELAVGDALTLGVHVLVLRPAPSSKSRRLADFGYLRARVEEECARAQRNGESFALLAVRVTSGSAPAVLDTLAAQLRPSDTLARLALPNTFAVLLPGPSPAEAAVILERIGQQLKQAGQGVRTALSCFPFDAGDATVLLARLTDLVVAARPVVAPSRDLVAGRSAEMTAIHASLERIAGGSISVLILGETGAGKDVIAEHIHRRSPRRAQPFLRLNCGALTENLLESELFGHERGSFTGAVQSKPGLLESAQGGTVFLDEIGELPLHLQVKLLQVLETRQVLRVGALRSVPIDVRFLAASNRELHAEVDSGRFRQDLLFRLEGFTVRVPPLRERPGEILPLAQQFLAEAARDSGRAAPRISDAAERLLLEQRWPGNVRELRNTMERAALLCDGVIEPSHLVRVPVAAPPDAREEERRRIIEALEQAAGNQTRAARALGMARSTFVLKLDAYGIPRPRK
jgi:two-component system, NtrC family, response regulator AtoC